ncbi:MAG TPA: hypothetical protein VFZ59_20120 [Verrucomicrobiae bacterium]|nr:hypothetical protein [Verrucomicrobiae bacterium]
MLFVRDTTFVRAGTDEVIELTDGDGWGLASMQAMTTPAQNNVRDKKGVLQ